MNEKELILAVKSGSEEAFKQLYDLWVSKLYRFVFQYLKSEEATDDVIQDTFLRIWTIRNQLKIEKSFKAYLFTIAYHFLLKEIKRLYNNPSMEEYVEYLNKETEQKGENEEIIDYDSFTEALRKAKQHLSPRQREIFELNKEQGMSVNEIAKELGITEQVVRNQLSTVLKILRNELYQYHPILILVLFIQ